jgi:hypothetical protein
MIMSLHVRMKRFCMQMMTAMKTIKIEKPSKRKVTALMTSLQKSLSGSSR